MCTFAALVPLAISAVSTGVQYQAQSSVAHAQASYQNRQYQAISKSALDSYKLQINGIETRIQQESAATSQQLLENREQGRASRGQVSVYAGNAGITGGIVTELMNQFSALEAANASTLVTNFNQRKAQLREEEKGLMANAQARITGATPAPVNKPSTLALGLNLANAGLSSLDKGLSQLPGGGKTTAVGNLLYGDIFGLTKP